jgi:hypothetical protein
MGDLQKIMGVATAGIQKVMGISVGSIQKVCGLTYPTGGGGGLPLTGWTYRKSITLSRASGAVSNYQMKLLVGESSGATGEDVDCGGLCLSSFNDIRFTKADGTTLLDYWIESVSGATPNQLVTIWIEFDSIGTGATTFYMYYGNAAAPAVSNGPNTFIFHDHFDAAMEKWSGDTGYCSIASSIMTISTAAAWRRIYGNVTAGLATCAVRGRVNFDATYAQFGLANTAFSHYGVLSREATSLIATKDGTTASASNTTITGDAYYIFDITSVGATNVRAFKDGVEMAGSPKTTNPPNTNALCATFGAYNATPCISCDWVLVRQYLATEPAWGSWGAQES